MNFLNENDPDPGFRFEGLLRTIFDNCNKYGDPWGYAAQDVYNNFDPEPKLILKRALSVGLCKLIYDNREKGRIEELIVLEEKIWMSKSQNEIIDIIDDSILWIIENHQ